MNSEIIIKGFFIFEKKTGRPFICRTYQNFKVDSFLIISFLNAMIKFAKEVTKEEGIDTIDMQELRFVFMVSRGIVFTVITSQIISSLDLEFKLKTLESLFFEKFSPKELLNISLNIDHYAVFNSIVDEIIHGDVKYLEIQNVQELKILLDNFKKNQQIFGIALISFTGNILVNSLEEDHLELVHKIINNLFKSHISGINNFFLKTIKYSIFIELISIDCYLVFISNLETEDDFEKDVFKLFRLKVSEILK